MVCQAPNNEGLASHYDERLYTLGVDMDRRRREMIKEEKEEWLKKEGYPY